MAQTYFKKEENWNKDGYHKKVALCENRVKRSYNLRSGLKNKNKQEGWSDINCTPNYNGKHSQCYNLQQKLKFVIPHLL